jgi:hypothetical protein
MDERGGDRRPFGHAPIAHSDAGSTLQLLQPNAASPLRCADLRRETRHD